jgi:hypothetical protein
MTAYNRSRGREIQKDFCSSETLEWFLCISRRFIASFIPYFSCKQVTIFKREARPGPFKPGETEETVKARCIPHG